MGANSQPLVKVLLSESDFEFEFAEYIIDFLFDSNATYDLDNLYYELQEHKVEVKNYNSFLRIERVKKRLDDYFSR